MRHIVIHLFLCAGTILATEARFEFAVVDEAGEPVADAHVIVGFDMSTGNGRSVERQVKVKTDVEGKATFQGETSDVVWVTAQKKGFYKSLVKEAKISGKDESNEKWLPWGNQYEVELRKKGDRTELYGKRVYWEIVPLNEGISYYDFVKGQWGNLGKGMCVEVDKKSDSWDVYLRFDNSHDGFIAAEKVSDQSVFQLPREAPEDGYSNRILVTSLLRNGKIIDGNEQYFLRQNTELDEEGNVISAEYGKIIEGFSCERTKTNDLKVNFGFVFNPKTRNLEYDMDYNKLSGLSPEQVLNRP